MEEVYFDFLDNCLTRVKMRNMNQTKSGSTSELRHRDSYQRYQRQSFWQIIAPIGLMGLLALAGMVFMVLSISGTRTGISVSQWSDASIIWMLLPLIIPAVMILILIILIIYGVTKVIQAVPGYSRLIHAYIKLYGLRVDIATRKTLAPLINLKSIFAGAGRFFSALLGRSGRKKISIE